MTAADIIEGMMKKGMKVEAVDVACIFGIEDKFPAQKLLTLVLQESRESLEGRKRKANNSPAIHLQVILHFYFKITFLFALLIGPAYRFFPERSKGKATDCSEICGEIS